MVKTLPSNAGGVDSIPSWEAKTHMPQGQKTQTLNRGNIGTNLLETLNMVQNRKSNPPHPPENLFLTVMEAEIDGAGRSGEVLIHDL